MNGLCIKRVEKGKSKQWGMLSHLGTAVVGRQCNPQAEGEGGVLGNE
jgi:hypothetical protein